MRLNTACKLRLSLTAFTLMSLVTSQPVKAQSVPSYSITDLGLGVAYGLNNQGQVVGQSEGDAFLYSNGVKQDLGTLGGPSSIAYGINDNSQVVGQADISSQNSHAFIWDAANGIQDLGTLADDYNGLGTALNGYDNSYARSINNQGQIVGGSVGTVVFSYPGSISIPQTTRVTRATLWDNGQVRELGISLGFVPAYPFSTTASAINNSGQVVGALQYGPGLSNSALWQNGVGFDLGAPNGNRNFANAINDKGQAVSTDILVGGVELKPITEGGISVKSYLFNVDSDTGTITSRTALSATTGPFIFGTALGINSQGQAVGYAISPLGLDPFALFWDSSSLATNLNKVSLDSPGWTLQKAYAINDAGQIVGSGQLNGQTHAYLLTPVSQPSSTP